MGFWLLTAVALVAGNGLWGGVLFGVYWLGRALPVWLAPMLSFSDEERVGVLIMDQANQAREVFRLVQAGASFWAAVILFVVGFQL